MTTARIAWVASLLALPLGAFAADLGVELDASLAYDDNVFKRTRRAQEDVLFRGEPRITFTQRDEDLEFDLGYSLAYDRGFKERRVNDVDQRFIGSGSFAFTDRTHLTASDRLSLDRTRSNQLALDGDLEISNQENLLKRNDASLGLNHAFSERTRAGVSVNYFWRESSLANRSRVNSSSASVNLSHQFTSRHRLGIGGSFVNQRFDQSNNQADSESNIFRLNGTWRWVVGPTTVLDVTAGPSLIESDQDGGRSSSDTSVFGAASLTKNWSPKLSTTASYQRRESRASGLGGTSILDAITVDVDWKLAQKWRLFLDGGLSQRTSVSDILRCPTIQPCSPSQAVKDNRAIDTDVWRAAASLHYRWNERVLLRLRGHYQDQSSRANTTGSNSDFENLLVLFGVRYSFEPIQLW